MSEKTGIDTEKIKEDLREEKQKYSEKRKTVAERVSNDMSRSIEDLMVSMRGIQDSIDTKIQDYKETSQSKIELDLIDSEKYYYLKINTAGVEKDNINIESSERQINITLEYPDTLESIDEEEDMSYIIQGLKTGFAKRIVKLPENIKFKEITAKYELGSVLLTIPKVDIEKYKVDLTE